MQLDQQNTNELLFNRSQLSSANHVHHERAEIMPPGQLNEHFQMLLDKENQKDVSIQLRQYFKRNPFIEAYDHGLLDMLINFFNSDSEYGIEGVNAAARIISAFLIYEYDYQRNPLFDCLLNYEFYQIIWPYFKQSPFVIVIFQFAILLEESEPNPSAYYFLMENEIFELAGKLLDQDFEFSIELLCLINSFDSYYNRSEKLPIETYELCINSISKIIPKICQKVFSSNNIDFIEYGCYCLESYGYHYVDIGINIFKNGFFQQKCKDFSVLTKQNMDETESLLQLIDKILNNKEPIERENGMYELCSKIRTEAMQFNSMFIELIFQIINSPYSESESDDEESDYVNCKDYEFFKNFALMLLSCLYLSEDEVNNFIENGFAQRLFDMLSMDCSFKSKARAFAAITNFVVFSSLESLKYFVENGFLYCITDYLDEMMTEIPHQIIDALESINRSGETKEECAEWSSLIFDNDDIVAVLDKASRGEYVDPGDSCMPLRLAAQAFLERRYNECIPE